MEYAETAATNGQNLPQHQPVVLSELDRATIAATSEMVRVLFGPASGPCWGSFPCSHHRIPGRLYAVTQSILFYSNMMGFENRICLQFSDIRSMALHRTTSIRFELVTDEVFVFKSFADRESVLQLLHGLQRLVLKDRKRGGRDDTDVLNSLLTDDDEQSYDEHGSYCGSLQDTIRSLHLPPTPHSVSRRRTASDSFVRLLSFEGNTASVSDTVSESLPSTSDAQIPAVEEVAVKEWDEVNHNIQNLENTGVDVSAVSSLN